MIVYTVGIYKKKILKLDLFVSNSSPWCNIMFYTTNFFRASFYTFSTP